MEKRADNPNNPNVEKHYEKGDRWRPYCISMLDWCTFDCTHFGCEECIVYQKAGEQIKVHYELSTEERIFGALFL